MCYVSFRLSEEWRSLPTKLVLKFYSFENDGLKLGNFIPCTRLVYFRRIIIELIVLDKFSYLNEGNFNLFAVRSHPLTRCVAISRVRAVRRASLCNWNSAVTDLRNTGAWVSQSCSLAESFNHGTISSTCKVVLIRGGDRFVSEQKLFFHAGTAILSGRLPSEKRRRAVVFESFFARLCFLPFFLFFLPFSLFFFSPSFRFVVSFRLAFPRQGFPSTFSRFVSRALAFRRNTCCIPTKLKC